MYSSHVKLYFYLLCVLASASLVQGSVLRNIANTSNASITTIDETATTQTSNLLRIVGGVEVNANSLPYQAALIINHNTFCGGAIISSRYILTAAHCTYNAKYGYAIVGAQNWKTMESTQQIYKVTNFIVYEEFSGSSAVQAHDISLVRVPSIYFNKYVKPIGLPSGDSGNFVGQLTVLSGWGATSDSSSAGLTSSLRKVYLTVARNSYCQQFFWDIILGSGQMCTQPQDVLSGVVGGCYGDSGGPLVRGNKVIGILSFGGTKCRQGKPSVYTRVSAYRQWIRKYSGI